jgi:hypothetical protein
MFMAWLCVIRLADVLVTGPRIELAIALIDRMKALFRHEGLAESRSTGTMEERQSPGTKDTAKVRYPKY